MFTFLLTKSQTIRLDRYNLYKNKTKKLHNDQVKREQKLTKILDKQEPEGLKIINDKAV